MANNNSAIQILGTNRYGWCIYRHSPNKLALDFGRHALVLTQPDFQALTCLLITAEMSAKDCSDGKQAQSRPERAIFSCAHHQLVIVLFDQAILRFTPDEFEALDELCQQVLASLPIVKVQDTVDYLANNIRPAMSHN